MSRKDWTEFWMKYVKKNKIIVEKMELTKYFLD